MSRRLRSFFLWLLLVAGLALLHWVSTTILHMPIASILTISLLITWLMPRPLVPLLILAVVCEMIAVTTPVVITIGILSPLLMFWLRGRISADLSFSYTVLVATSAALALGIVVAGDAYPHFSSIPWPTVLLTWAVVTATATCITVMFPSITSRYLHDRYH